MSDDQGPAAGDSDAASPGDAQGSSPKLVFAVLSLSLLAFVMQFGMISVALDDMFRDLEAPIRWGGSVLTLFMTGQVISMAVSGRLADRFGPRNMFVLGFGSFAAASLLCAAAPNIYVLIGGRFLQGLGGGTLLPSGMALIAEAFAANRARAIGVYSSILPFGAVLGPTVGGGLVDVAGWRWTFLVNVPMGVIAVLAVLVVLPRGERKPPQPIDWVGVLLLGGAMAPLIFALSELGRSDPGPSIPLVATSGAASAFFWVTFVVHERRVRVPALDIALLSRRDILASNLTSLFVGMSWIGVIQWAPYYMQQDYGLSASATGALMAPRAAFMAASSMLGALVLYRTGYRLPVAMGLVVMAFSLLMLALGVHDPSAGPVSVDSFWWLLAVILIAGAGRGITNPSLNNAGMDVLPDQVASIAGLRATFQTFGGVIGISMMALLAARNDDVASGLELGFALAAVLLLGAILLVPFMPEMPGLGGGGRRPIARRRVSTTAATHEVPGARR